MSTSRNLLMLDCESIGLWGEVFAYGAILFTEDGSVIREFAEACPPSVAMGSVEDHAWVETHVPALKRTCNTPAHIRDRFWKLWRMGSDSLSGPSMTLVVDCGWPVEHNFVSRCVRDDTAGRGWDGPHPIYDVSTLRAAVHASHGGAVVARLDERLPHEIPQHDPLRDARHSIRVWMALNTILRNGK